MTARDPQSSAVVSLFHPRQHVWSDPFVWSVDGLLLMGLTPMGRATIAALALNRERVVAIRAADVAECSVVRQPRAVSDRQRSPGGISRGDRTGAREFTQLSFALLFAHAATHDLPVLEVLLRLDIRYIGVLGSSRRAATLATRLRERGFTAGEIARLHMPVGLALGAKTAEQMAVAVVGELLMVRSGRSGQSLRLVKGIVPSSCSGRVPVLLFRWQGGLTFPP